MDNSTLIIAVSLLCVLNFVLWPLCCGMGWRVFVFPFRAYWWLVCLWWSFGRWNLCFALSVVVWPFSHVWVGRRRWGVIGKASGECLLECFGFAPRDHGEGELWTPVVDTREDDEWDSWFDEMMVVSDLHDLR